MRVRTEKKASMRASRLNGSDKSSGRMRFGSHPWEKPTQKAEVIIAICVIGYLMGQAQAPEFSCDFAFVQCTRSVTWPAILSASFRCPLLHPVLLENPI